jgi:hypothetical protein
MKQSLFFALLFCVFSAGHAADNHTFTFLTGPAADYYGFTDEELKKVEAIDLAALSNNSTRSLAQFLVLKGLDPDNVTAALKGQRHSKVDKSAKVRAIVLPSFGLFSFTQQDVGGNGLVRNIL